MGKKVQASLGLSTYLSVCTGSFAGREWVFAAQPVDPNIWQRLDEATEHLSHLPEQK